MQKQKLKTGPVIQIFSKRDEKQALWVLILHSSHFISKPPKLLINPSNCLVGISKTFLKYKMIILQQDSTENILTLL